MEKATMKDEGYSFHQWLKGGGAIFKNDEGGFEIFQANKNHASWGFSWRGTDWEFCRSIYP
jgi:hypothetical protein